MLVLARDSAWAGAGWILGHKIDGTQAEYVHVPFADTLTYPAPAGVTDEQLLTLADILPTGYESACPTTRSGPATWSTWSGPARSDCRPSWEPGSTAPATSWPSTRPTPGSKRPSSSAPMSASTTEPPRRAGSRPGAHPTASAPTWPSRRSACPPPSSSPPSSSARAGASPTSAGTASRPRCTSRISGSSTSPSPPGWSTPTRPRRCSTRVRPPTRRRAVRHPPRPRRLRRGLRRVRPSRRDRRPQGATQPALKEVVMNITAT